MTWTSSRLGNHLRVKHGFAFQSGFFRPDGELAVLTPGHFFEEGGFRTREGTEKYYHGEFPEQWWHEVSLRQITRESKLRNSGRYGRNAVRAVTNSADMIPMRAQTIAENLDRYKVVEPNGFAYNPMRINVGSICMWDGAAPVLVSPDYVVFNCNEGELDPDFFNHLRQTHRWNFYMNVAGNGSVRVRIYYANLAALHFKIPPYREQKKISAALRTADREIGLLRDQLAALKTKKKQASGAQSRLWKTAFVGISATRFRKASSSALTGAEPSYRVTWMRSSSAVSTSPASADHGSAGSGVSLNSIYRSSRRGATSMVRATALKENQYSRPPGSAGRP